MYNITALIGETYLLIPRFNGLLSGQSPPSVSLPRVSSSRRSQSLSIWQVLNESAEINSRCLSIIRYPNKPLEWTGHQLLSAPPPPSSLPATQGQRYASHQRITPPDQHVFCLQRSTTKKLAWPYSVPSRPKARDTLLRVGFLMNLWEVELFCLIN